MTSACGGASRSRASAEIALAQRLQKRCSFHANDERKTNIMKTSKKLSLSIKTNLKAGGLGTINHNRSGLKVRSAIKAGGLGTINHNRSGLKVRSAIKAGGLGTINHNRSTR
jgi:hypothetical protein